MARSLRDIEACLRAHSTKLYHLGTRGNVAGNTLANANAKRDWRIYCAFAQRLIAIARRHATEFVIWGTRDHNRQATGGEEEIGDNSNQSRW